jgi:hypothetical protein
MSGDERATVAALDAARAVFRHHIESSRGRVIDNGRRLRAGGVRDRDRGGVDGARRRAPL